MARVVRFQAGNEPKEKYLRWPWGMGCGLARAPIYGWGGGRPRDLNLWDYNNRVSCRRSPGLDCGDAHSGRIAPPFGKRVPTGCRFRGRGRGFPGDEPLRGRRLPSCTGWASAFGRSSAVRSGTRKGRELIRSGRQVSLVRPGRARAAWEGAVRSAMLPAPLKRKRNGAFKGIGG